jgi:plastocyanin
MPSRTVIGLAIASLLMLAACGSTTSSPAASTAASTAPSTAASAGAGGAVCSETKDAGAVAVSIKDFAFNPTAVTAKVGQVIAFTNNDTTDHTATLVDGGCTTPHIAGGSSDGLVFTAAGSYPFHCTIHSQMTGTITVTS